jgi:hypothetical protein
MKPPHCSRVTRIAQPLFAQISSNGVNTLNVTGDAAVMVMPDRVRLFWESNRNKVLSWRQRTTLA